MVWKQRSAIVYRDRFGLRVAIIFLTQNTGIITVNTVHLPEPKRKGIFWLNP